MPWLPDSSLKPTRSATCLIPIIMQFSLYPFKEENMPRNKQFASLWMMIFLVILVALACRIGPIWIGGGEPTPFTGIDPHMIETNRALITPLPTPQCGGNVTGAWIGYAENSKGRVTYYMRLTQTDCTVTGTSKTEDIVSTVKGNVDQGVFHYSESGTGNNCYWKANLTIQPPGNKMTGSVTNCSKKQIFLEK
jgi:hypothetical protein